MKGQQGCKQSDPLLVNLRLNDVHHVEGNHQQQYRDDQIDRAAKARIYVGKRNREKRQRDSGDGNRQAVEDLTQTGWRLPAIERACLARSSSGSSFTLVTGHRIP